MILYLVFNSGSKNYQNDLPHNLPHNLQLCQKLTFRCHRFPIFRGATAQELQHFESRRKKHLKTLDEKNITCKADHHTVTPACDSALDKVGISSNLSCATIRTEYKKYMADSRSEFSAYVAGE